MRTRALALGMLMPGLSQATVPDWLAGALADGVETVCLFDEATGTPARTADTTRALRAVRPDVVVTTDEESGEVARLEADDGSSLPSPLALGRIDDPDVTVAAARLSGRLMRRAGIDWALAPVADVNTEPSNPVIGVRSFGQDPRTVAAHATAWVDGLRAAGVSGCVKHFPGHGDTRVDSHESLPSIDKAKDALTTAELVPFVAAVEDGVQAVMTGHLLLPSVDPEAPASLSPTVTTGLLREELGFAGVIVTDAIEMEAISGTLDLGEAAVRAIVAGADLVCVGAADQEIAYADCARAVLAAVDDGRIAVERLRESASRRGGLRLRPTSMPAISADIDIVANAAPRALRTHGDPRVDAGLVTVVRADGGPGMAAGDSTWSVAAALTGLGRDVRVIDLGEAVPRPEASGALLIEVRDSWKDPRLHARLARLLADRPDAVVIDTGWPLPADPRVRGWVSTYGGGRMACALAASVVLGRDPRAAAHDLLTTTFEEDR